MYTVPAFFHLSTKFQISSTLFLPLSPEFLSKTVSCTYKEIFHDIYFTEQMVGFIRPDLEPRVPVFSGLAKKSVFRNRDIFRIRIELFFPESGSGSAENPDPIRKNPDPEP